MLWLARRRRRIRERSSLGRKMVEVGTSSEFGRKLVESRKLVETWRSITHE